MGSLRAFLVLTALLLAVPAAASAKGSLSVEGGRLVDDAGRTVVLHGLNVVYKVPPYVPNGSSERTSFDADDAARLESWGFNSIRLGVSWKALMPQPGQVDSAY